MNKIQLSELLEKYIHGNCTPEEIAVIDQWYKNYSNGPDYLNTLPVNERELLEQKMLLKIMSNVDNDGLKQQEKPSGKVVSIVSRWWFTVPVAAMLLVLIKFFVFNDGTDQRRNEAAKPQTLLVNNTHAIVKQVLPDGSIAWLKPQASLTYPKIFKASSRNVSMKGECFFEITKNPQQPFIISSKHITTKVWGTSFEVADYDNAHQVTVTVVSGKVSVNKRGSKGEEASAKLSASEVMLKPEQKATYKQDRDVLVTDTKADITRLDLWKRVDLSFNNDKLASIINALEKKFNVTIEVSDSKLNNKAMTADLTGLNLPEVLEVLKTSMKINYEIISDDRINLKRAN